MIVASRRKFKIGTVLNIPIIITHVNGVTKRIPPRPHVITEIATFDEWVKDSKKRCGPPPRGFRRDPRLYYYKVSTKLIESIIESIL